jgi:hypothetical protein
MLEKAQSVLLERRVGSPVLRLEIHNDATYFRCTGANDTLVVEVKGIGHVWTSQFAMGATKCSVEPVPSRPREGEGSAESTLQLTSSILAQPSMFRDFTLRSLTSHVFFATVGSLGWITVWTEVFAIQDPRCLQEVYMRFGRVDQNRNACVFVPSCLPSIV